MKNINLQDLFKKKTENTELKVVTAWPGNAQKHWKIMVSVFALGLAILSVLALKIYLSDQIAGGYFGSEASVTNASVKKMDVKKLKADLLIMQKKQTTYQNLKANPPKLVDPAI